MNISQIAAFMLKHRGEMPLTDGVADLVRYIEHAVRNESIRVCVTSGGIEGVMLWTKSSSEDPDHWDRYDPQGKRVVIFHLVTRTKKATGRMAQFLLDRYPDEVEFFAERKGERVTYRRRHLKRIARYGKES